MHVTKSILKGGSIVVALDLRIIDLWDMYPAFYNQRKVTDSSILLG